MRATPVQSDSRTGAGAACSITSAGWRALAAPAVLTACTVWSYWSTLKELVQFWLRNQDYSVGLLVPPVALFLVCRQLGDLRSVPRRAGWWGLGLLLGAEALRQFGLYYGVGSAERYALLITVAGTVWLVCGWAVLRRLGWVLAFLLLMVPLPARLHEAVALPLQRMATTLTVSGLQLLGFFVSREGNVIHVEDQTTVAVAEACSGLRMLTAFVFVAALLAFLVHRPRWQKALLLVFSVPIAVLSNALRGLATAAFAHCSGSPELTEDFHDAAGLAMMPLALFMSLGLFKYLALFSRASGRARKAPPPRSGEPDQKHSEPRVSPARSRKLIAES